MKVMKNDNTLSHIIIYVDETYQNKDICAFCTNISINNSRIKTYVRSYDNQYSIYEQLENVSSDEGVFYITDNDAICGILANKKLAFAVLITDYNKSKSFRQALYCIEDIANITYEVILRMWQRYNNIPWTICKTDRIVIREQTVEDIDDLYEMYKDESTTKYMDNLYEDRDEEIQYMKDYISHQYRFCEYGIWTIVDANNGEYIGRAGVSNRASYDELELGYVITPRYRNKGYANEACTRIIEYMKDNYDIDSIIAFTLQENEASVALLKKLGFTNEDRAIIDGKEHLLYRRILT